MTAIAALDPMPVSVTGGPVLETERLMLRLPQPGDWPAYRDYRMSARSSIGAVAQVRQIWSMFSDMFGHWAIRGYGRFVATLKDTGRPVGHFGPIFPEGHPERELTWTLWDAGLEGRGYAHEGAVAARDHLIRDLGWTGFVSNIAPWNRRSQALAARLGAVHDTSAVNPYGDDTQVWRHVIPTPSPEVSA